MAGASMKDIKRRIKSVENTMQITKAMELVASSKLRKAKERVEQSRPYFNIIKETIKEILSNTKFTESHYTKTRPVKNSLYIIIAGDRGLAGGYNSNLIKFAVNEMKGKNSKIIAIGRKAQEFFVKRDYEVVESYLNIAETLSFGDTNRIVADAIKEFDDKKVDEVFVCYTEFVSTLSQVPKVEKILPLDINDFEIEKAKKISIEYEPSAGFVFKRLVPMYLEGILYATVVDSFASEQGARRTAMESATDNANEMIDGLNLQYNRARQAAITQEISEIVGGAEALQ